MHKKTWNLFSVGLLFPGMGVAVKPSKYAIGENRLSLFQKVSVANSLLVRTGAQGLLPLLSARICV